MKTLGIALFTLITFATTTVSQENETINATFIGYENEIFNFTAEDDTKYEFHGLKTKAKDKYDLTDESFEGKVFTVTYNTINTNHEETKENIIRNIIVDLEMVE